jgi:UTP--glucose-1-phosphate uridylyltransferase
LHPVTKVLPKEMFPVGRHPAIEWVIAEAAACGCREIAVVISPRKQVIREYLTKYGSISPAFCELMFITQSEPLGLGHALLLAREFAEGQPVAVLLPDELTAGPQLPILKLNEAFTTLGGAVFALGRAKSAANPRWSEWWNLTKVDSRTYRVQPSRTAAPSEKTSDRLVGMGRYILSPECLDDAATLFNARPHTGLDDGMIFEFMCAADKPVHGYIIEGRRFDISTIAGYMDAWKTLGQSTPLSLFPQIPALSITS